ncbi:unnamed protein product, partial [Tetraodon nigroviridis]
LRKEQVESVNVGGTRNIITGEETRRFEGLWVPEHPQAGVHQHHQRGLHGGANQGAKKSSASYVPSDRVSTSRTPSSGRVCADGRFRCLFQYIDHYSRTKAVAEQMILSADGIPLKGAGPLLSPVRVGGLLRTCALRPSGIYGPDERRHLYRVMMNVERRLFFFRFGDPQARMNWVHVDNLILAHRLAAEALTQQRGYVSV